MLDPIDVRRHGAGAARTVRHPHPAVEVEPEETIHPSYFRYAQPNEKPFPNNWKSIRNALKPSLQSATRLIHKAMLG